MAVDLTMNVLTVDDDQSMRGVLGKLLRQLNFANIDEASDGAEALRKLRQGDFGLVISDWNMAPMDGIELLREVRADAKLKDLPFIVVTAETRSDKMMAAKEAGVSNYLVKPFNAVALKGKLVKVLGEF
ncbi:MAG: response regulator [Rhodospirillales bacterium]